MCPDLEQLGKLIPKEAIGRLYDDMLSGLAKELGKLGADAAKVARLLLAPLQVLAAFQDRFENMVKRIAERVPETRRVSPPAELLGPALHHMRYLEDNSALWSMYEEVLTKSIDREGNTVIHPSFTHLISQLSRDEAWVLYRLKERPFNVTDHLDYNRASNRFSNRVIEYSELPKDELYQPQNIELYYSHLKSLNLVTWPVESEEYPRNAAGEQIGLRRHSKMMLTDFGRLFVTACIPEKGFEHHAKR